MSKITLGPVNYYDISDIYYYSVDNRPLYNISNNLDIVNTAVSYLGFYQEISANPATEPAGGFAIPSCAYQGPNGLLYPIDISQPITSLDYTQYPIYLVIKNLGSSTYQCLAFSASLTINSLFNKFLPASIGRALKVGPGGALVDEISFDLYYGSYGYQNLYVGKILTPNTISFGGNQVSMLGDNRFLVKNADDSTTGLITHYVNNVNTSTAQKTILINNAGSPYPFSEIINQIGSTTVGGLTTPTPVFFTSAALQTDGNGVFTIPNINTVLNEVHFASPVVAAASLDSNKLGTAGVNFNSLISFAQNYLLHNETFSTNLQEGSQTINTSILFDNTNALFTTGLQLQFQPVSATFGLDSVAYGSVLGNLATALQTLSSGLSFGSYKQNGIGAFVGYVSNTALSTATFTDGTSYAASNLVGSSALSIINKNSTTNALVSLDTDYIILNASVGAFYGNTPSVPLELTNKAYVDAAVASAANASTSKIPLAGSTTSAPITGSLYSNVTANADSSTVLILNTMLNTSILSNNPITFYGIASGSAASPQILRGFTLPDTNSGALSSPSYGSPVGDSPTGQYAGLVPEGSDFTTRDYVTTYITAKLTSGTGYALLGSYGSTPTANNFYGDNLFKDSSGGPSLITFASATTSFAIAPTGSVAATITCATPSITLSSAVSAFGLYYGGAFSLSSIPTTTGSAYDYMLVPKNYVDVQVPTLIANALGPVICGTWLFKPVTRVASVSKLGLTWYFPYMTTVPDIDGSLTSSFSTYFSVNSGDNGLKFNGIPDPTNPLNPPIGAMFSITVLDSRVTNPGGAVGNQFQTQTAIITTGDVVLARQVLDEDNDAGRLSGLPSTTCSTSVYLAPGALLYLLTTNGEYASASIVRIR